MKYKDTIKNFEINFDNKKIRKLKDLKGIFMNFNLSEKKILNEIVYETYTKKLSPINLTLTILYPGKINEEFYMTKGHIHKTKTPEFYILIEGKGILLTQKGNKIKTTNMKRGKIELIYGDWAHRIINTGNKKMKVMTIYHENSKPDYNITFKRRFFANKY
ncbi:MAG: glucose-6-phosphate isomerase family protein [Candidatus Pacearchaeota archaeon]